MKTIYHIRVETGDPRDDRDFILTREERKDQVLVWVAERYPDATIVIDEIRDTPRPVALWN